MWNSRLFLEFDCRHSNHGRVNINSNITRDMICTTLSYSAHSCVTPAWHKEVQLHILVRAVCVTFHCLPHKQLKPSSCGVAKVQTMQCMEIVGVETVRLRLWFIWKKKLLCISLHSRRAQCYWQCLQWTSRTTFLDTCRSQCVSKVMYKSWGTPLEIKMGRLKIERLAVSIQFVRTSLCCLIATLGI